jgi:molybdopterin synthase catalytic subunit
MALSTMLELCDSIRRQWSVLNITIQHKLGPCPIKEISVGIVISSEHRKDGLGALQFAIDDLKAKVPIWKKEHYGDGHANWKSNAPLVESVETLNEEATK